MAKAKFQIGEEVGLTDKCPLYIQMRYNPDSKGKVVSYSGGIYEVEMSTENLHLRGNCLKSVSVPVTFVSVWDGGTEIRTNALFNQETKLVHDIEVVDGVDEDGEEVELLEKQYIELSSGEIIEESGFILED